MPSTLEIEKRIQKRLLILNKFNAKCAYCGCDINGNNFHADHIVPKLSGLINKDIPRSKKGTDNIENLNPCCRSCNSSKSTLSVEGFRIRILDRVSRLNEFSSNYQIAKRFSLIKEDIKPVVFYFETLQTDAK